MRDLYPLTAAIGALGLIVIILFRTVILTIISDRHLTTGRRRKVAEPIMAENYGTPVWPV